MTANRFLAGCVLTAVIAHVYADMRSGVRHMADREISRNDLLAAGVSDRQYCLAFAAATRTGPLVRWVVRERVVRAVLMASAVEAERVRVQALRGVENFFGDSK